MSRYDHVKKGELELEIGELEMTFPVPGAYLKIVPDFPDKDDEATHQQTPPGKDMGSNKIGFGSKHVPHSFDPGCHSLN
jgi:hypothetical protein